MNNNKYVKKGFQPTSTITVHTSSEAFTNNIKNHAYLGLLKEIRCVSAKHRSLKHF
jgi:hypothetical protein